VGLGRIVTDAALDPIETRPYPGRIQSDDTFDQRMISHQTSWHGVHSRGDHDTALGAVQSTFPLLISAQPSIVNLQA
jgi:hypothetical protein